MEGSSVQARSAGQGLEEACIDRQRSGTGDGSQPTPNTRTEVPILKQSRTRPYPSKGLVTSALQPAIKLASTAAFPLPCGVMLGKSGAASKLQVACRLAAQ
jgi:hypothetical protein